MRTNVRVAFIYAYSGDGRLSAIDGICPCIFKCRFIITSDSTLFARLLRGPANELSSNIDGRELLTCKTQGHGAYPRSSAIIKKQLARHSACVGKQYSIKDAVDGRKSAPPGMYKTLLVMGKTTYQLV